MDAFIDISPGLLIGPTGNLPAILDNLVLYAACEVDKRKTDALAYIKKLDGRTGKVLWEYSCKCKYDANVNGGVLSSPIIGKNSISDLVIFSISKTTSNRAGKLVALNKETGDLVWEKECDIGSEGGNPYCTGAIFENKFKVKYKY